MKKVLILSATALILALVAWRFLGAPASDGDSPADGPPASASGPGLRQPTPLPAGSAVPVVREAPQTTGLGLNAEIAEKWFVEEGYTDEDIAEAQQLLRQQGFPEDRLTDAGLIRRHLLPRVVTSVQIAAIEVPARVPAHAPIPFVMRGAVPTPEFNFVRFDSVRQDDIIRLRALGHSPAYDEASGTPARMLPVELEGELDPLPPGSYRLLIPELGVEGVVPLLVE
ncbi:MAG TPA: hypothetical protein PKE26_07620 [Kiritimatiellia bacterium]|nr:hypothetical protein [Kiritimatiellia bacterium]HMO98960.1 hypothetical protein [Kiritimatiellia bacterium]HMP96416.1 hypothetical protein [Kiritimatiellia bacterium]